MSDILKTASIELDVITGDKQANVAHAEQLIGSLSADFDIVILPEMFSTGFICDKDKALSLSETTSGETITRLKALSREQNMALCGSFIARDGQRLFNRAFFIEPSGDEYYYDKHHLFTYGGEHSVYSCGESPVPVFRFRGWNIAMAICYDLRFPAWLRNDRGAYDLLLIMANWPDSRSFAWEHLLIARALENQCYVVSCNRSGSDEYGSYSGISPAIGPKGNSVATRINGNIIASELSRSSLVKFRAKFPVYLENDRFRFQ